MRTKGAERVRQLLDELIAKLWERDRVASELSAGNLWAARFRREPRRRRDARL